MSGYMNRRGFFGSLAALTGTMALDPERLLWRPTKTIFIPKAFEVADFTWSPAAFDNELIFYIEYMDVNEYRQRFSTTPMGDGLYRVEFQDDIKWDVTESSFTLT
jgi:hypothetical protein